VNFEVESIKLETNALRLSYYLVPWDSELLSRPVAQIADIEVGSSDIASKDFLKFVQWKKDQNIKFSSCRLPENKTQECQLLQQFGYRYVELNYRPELDLNRIKSKLDEGFQFVPALESDKNKLINIAATVFRSGRFHDDPNLGPEVGNLRYGQWMKNAFSNPLQEVIKCVHQQRTTAFFVQEKHENDEVFWSLVGLVPGAEGKGLGGRVWRSYLAQLNAAGVKKVSTSISSRNVPVFNLYVSLGFRFPQPSVTLHWHSDYSTS